MNAVKNFTPRDALCIFGLLMAFSSFFWLLNARGPITTTSELNGVVITTNHTKWAMITALQAGTGLLIIALATFEKKDA